MAFCDRCMQPECTRSRFGTSKFEHRVGNWYETLFANPPRMTPDDPLYAKLAGQKFLMVEPGGPLEVQSWTDPRDLVDSTPTVITPPVENSPIEPAKVAKDSTQKGDSKSQILNLTHMNTPKAEPKMLGNSLIPQEKKGSWVEPEAPTGEKIVAPGSKIRLTRTPKGV